MNKKGRLLCILYYIAVVLLVAVILLSVKYKNVVISTVSAAVLSFSAGALDFLRTIDKKQCDQSLGLQLKDHRRLIIYKIIYCLSAILVFYSHFLRFLAQLSADMPRLWLSAFALISWVPVILFGILEKKEKDKIINDPVSL
mgnify:FL=1